VISDRQLELLAEHHPVGNNKRAHGAEVMNLSKPFAIVSSSVLALLLLGCAEETVVVRPAGADQPNMVASREHLQQARAFLVRAEPNKGGHRVRAIELVDQAIAEVNAGIEFARTH
jgi:hypothetical protein